MPEPMTATLRIAQVPARSSSAGVPLDRITLADGREDRQVIRRKKENVVQRPWTQQGGRKEEEIRPGRSTDSGTRPRGRLHDARVCRRMAGTACRMPVVALRSINLIVRGAGLETGCVRNPSASVTGRSSAAPPPALIVH
jgi:hypothetical protein